MCRSITLRFAWCMARLELDFTVFTTVETLPTLSAALMVTYPVMAMHHQKQNPWIIYEIFQSLIYASRELIT